LNVSIGKAVSVTKGTVSTIYCLFPPTLFDG
jgi:hypothetical protein